VTVLVTYATKYGSTEEIAETIGRELQRRGLEADVLSVGEVEDVDDYDAVVLGSAVYVGRWLSNARAFVKKHARKLVGRPTWLFSSGPVGNPLRPTDEDAVQIDEILRATAALEHRIFPGRLVRSKLNRCDWAVVVALRVQEGDYRDDAEIAAWAREIAASLERQPSSRPSSRA
jgi:menaquinone-dependent protoporphyrinogen oxidase